jgi:hypothetical protein
MALMEPMVLTVQTALLAQQDLQAQRALLDRTHFLARTHDLKFSESLILRHCQCFKLLVLDLQQAQVLHQ